MIGPEQHATDAPRFAIDELDRFCRAALAAAGADEATSDAATRAMNHGSLLGIDSHGVRLLDHYVTAIGNGRVNATPNIRIVGESGAVASVDADHGHGALAAYVAMEHAVRLARSYGVGAVAVRNSSHFGPAGAFALAAANAGMIGITTCNSDSFVRLHDGAGRFHGTNPIAGAVPVEGRRPWLLDMATSAITFNKVQLHKSVGERLPPGTASREDGEDTEDSAEAAMLAPLGGSFGFKGAGLAGLAEIFSAVLSGMRLSFEIAPMAGSDFRTPRRLGAFVLALRPSSFIDMDNFDRGMNRYLAALRRSPARPGAKVMAPGDKEWAEADLRARNGVPLDPTTIKAFGRLAERFALAMPRELHNNSLTEAAAEWDPDAEGVVDPVGLRPATRKSREEEEKR